jgi:prepilin-type N-terminal cleavage/methylation domain-containing protein/prepilin-type processing-associated H-X9-DG protein
MRAKKLRGFTLVELLVVIAIIGVLVALLLPAIQAAREAARRNQCVNNLKQMGIALQMHHDSKKTFPAGRTNTTRGPGSATDPLGVSWAFQLLPSMEQRTIFDSLVNNATVDDLKNAQAMRSPVDVFYCPSRRNPVADRDFDKNDEAPADEHRAIAAGGDYAGSGGLYNGFIKDPLQTDVYLLTEGTLYTRSAVSIRNASDGTASTFAIGEKYKLTEDEARNQTGFDEGRLHYFQADTAFFPGDNEETILSGTECGLAHGGSVGLPTTCDKDDLRKQFGSNHAQICNFVFLDGHVQGVSQSVDLTTLQRLSMIGDGNVVDATNL